MPAAAIPTNCQHGDRNGRRSWTHEREHASGRSTGGLNAIAQTPEVALTLCSCHARWCCRHVLRLLLTHVQALEDGVVVETIVHARENGSDNEDDDTDLALVLLGARSDYTLSGTHVITTVRKVTYVLAAALDRVEPRAEAEARHSRNAVAGEGGLVDDGGGRERVGAGEGAKDVGKVGAGNMEREENGKENGADRVRVDVDRLVVDIWALVS